MSSSGDKSVDKSSDGSSDHVPDWDPDKAVFTFSMSSSENATKGKGGKEGTPVRGVLQPAADADANTKVEQKASQEKQRTSKATAETWSVLEDTPLQKRKRVSFTQLPDAPNHPLSTPDPNSGNQQPESGPTPKPSQKKKRVSFAGISGFPKRPLTPSKTPGKQKTRSTPRKKIPKTLTTVTTNATATPTVLTYPKLPPSPTYHSDLPKPVEPKPLDKDSFHDLTEENNLLRTRVQVFEKLDDTILAAAAPIGAIAFSEITDTQIIDPVRQTLCTVDRPAAEACLVLLDKLTETQAGLAASRTEGMEQFIKFEEADEEARRGKILMERIGLLEESNEVLGAEKDELTRLCLSRHLTAQERGQYINALAETNKRFKEIQINDKETIARLQGEVNDLNRENRGLEQQRVTFAKSAEVYIKKLCKDGGFTTTAAAESSSTAGSQSDAYHEETKKAAEGLAEVMDLLSGKNYVDAIIPDSPFVFLLRIVREYASSIRDGGSQIPPPPVTAESESSELSDPPSESSDLDTASAYILEKDPCQKVKILLKTRTDELQSMTKNYDELKRKNDMNNMSNQQILIMYKAQTAELNGATEALKQYEVESTATAAELETLRREIVDLQGANEELFEVIDDIRTPQKSRTSIEEDRARLLRSTRSELAKVGLEKKLLDSTITNLRDQIADLRKTISLNLIENTSKDKLIEGIRAEYLKLEKSPEDIEALRASLKGMDDECGKAKKQLSELQQTSTTQIGALRAETAFLKGSHEKSKKQLFELQKECATRIAALQAEIASLKGMSDEDGGAKKQLLELQKECATRIAALQAEIASLKGISDEGGGAKKQLLELQKESAEQIGALRAEIENLGQKKKNAPTIQAQMDVLLEAERRLLKLQNSRINELQAVISIWEGINMSSEDSAIEQVRWLRDTSSKKDGYIKALQVEVERLRNALPTKTTGGGGGLDPCANIKKELLDVQADSTKKDGRIKYLEAEIDRLTNVLTDALSAGTPGDGVDPCIWVKKQLSDVQAASTRKDDMITHLQAEIHKVKAKLKKYTADDMSAGYKRNIVELQGRLNNVRKRLKIRKQAQDALEGKLVRSKAIRAAPSKREFEMRLQEITARQKQTYVKRINRLYRIKQEQMFPVISNADGPTGFPETCLRDLLRQDGPPIKEISDRWFMVQWDELYDQIAILCQINYRARIDHMQYDYGVSAGREELLSYYLRDVVVSEAAMHDRINSLTEIFAYTYRAKIAIAVIFRILVEEIFDPIRFLLFMQFPDSARWKTKLQFRQAFEHLENPRFPRAETMRGFQERESWCTRKAAQTDKVVYHPSKHRDPNFNYFKQIEERDYDGNIGDPLILNTARAKMMLAMFQTVDDSVLHERFQEVRANVSVLIRDTLAPLRLPRAGVPPPGTREAWNGAALKFNVEEIVRFAFDLAVTMRSQRRIIYVNLEQLELRDMMSFKTATMTDVEQPETNSDRQRNIHDEDVQAVADGFENDVMNLNGKVEAVVQPALWRKGSENGDYAAANIQVLRKSKVIHRVKAKGVNV